MATERRFFVKSGLQKRVVQVMSGFARGASNPLVRASYPPPIFVKFDIFSGKMFDGHVLGLIRLQATNEEDTKKFLKFRILGPIGTGIHAR